MVPEINLYLIENGATKAVRSNKIKWKHFRHLAKMETKMKSLQSSIWSQQKK